MRRLTRGRSHVGAAGAAVVVLITTVILVQAHAAGPASRVWEPLEPGLDLGTFVAPQRAETGDSTIRILRIDPTHFALHLLSVSAIPSGTRHTAKEWVRRHGLVAAVNASLYQADYRTSVSLMTTGTHTNNPRLSKDNAVLAFDRLAGMVPAVQIIDRTCQDFSALRKRYGTLVQSIRMISCRGENVWSQQPTKWSTAAIAVDQLGRVLFIHVRSPYSTHDLIDNLLALPIDLKNAMYVEGGPEAQLFVSAGGRELEFVGSHGSSFEGNLYGLPIPNVVGVRRIKDDQQDDGG